MLHFSSTVQYIFLSHDVDWRKQGAPIEHILERKERFDKVTIDNLETRNPYYNIPDYMEIEDRYGVKSTFFFRTIYEGGHFIEYEDEIHSLIRGGWEIGLHSDPKSVNSLKKLTEEKERLELITKHPITANRVHYLNSDVELASMLQSLGFIYDSSVKKRKDRVTKDDLGFYKIGNLIEFPVTLMDAYLFTYMKIKEPQIVELFEKTLDYCKNVKKDIITVIWHDNVLKMTGGRMYSSILQYLTSRDDVKVCRGIDLAKMINRLAVVPS
jgi:peptidoglycan/xylan/chitin deacetylase (PgdA/CDA1 family)